MYMGAIALISVGALFFFGTITRIYLFARYGGVISMKLDFGGMVFGGAMLGFGLFSLVRLYLDVPAREAYKAKLAAETPEQRRARATGGVILTVVFVATSGLIAYMFATMNDAPRTR